MTNPKDDTPAVPGEMEYAALAKSEFDIMYERFKRSFRGGEDLFAITFACAHTNGEAMCSGVDGEPELLVKSMAAAIHQIAMQVQAKIWTQERFLPKKNQTPYHKIVAGVINDLLQTVRDMRQEKVDDSGIIDPSKPTR